MFAPNPMMLIDGYKLDHRRQYPNGTTKVYSNWTARESRIQDQESTIPFGRQYFLQRYMMDNMERFFNSNADIVCARYKRTVDNYLGPNEIGTDHIRALHDLGYMPLRFSGIPEGVSVPLRVPQHLVENTHPDFFWLVNYIETIMSCEMWLPSTSATKAARLRKLINKAGKNTDSAPEFVQWQGHDFSFRGMPGLDAAMASGAGHLLAFSGSDTMPAMEWIENYYGPLPADYLIAGSVAATEHSVMCAGGSEAGDEMATFGRILDLYKTGIVSVVSDTWDLWHVTTTILPQLKERVMAREGKLVIRPDSGDPADIICGDPLATGPANKGVVQLLWELFGGTKTSTGHNLLDSHIGCIYGDSITYERAKEITERLAAKGFAAGNVVFGIGSYTYQGNTTRDTFGHAMKATWVEVDGKGRDLFKSPVTGNGMKTSAKGRLAVIPDAAGKLTLINQATPAQERESVLKVVWEDGVFTRRQTYDTIRAQVQADINA